MELTIGERIRVLRGKGYLNLTQAEFAERIRLKQSSIGLYENGERKISDITIAAICHEFNVSEEWLRTGNGEMFTALSSEVVESISESFNLGTLGKRFVSVIADMDEKELQMIYSFMVKVVDGGSPAAMRGKEEAAEEISPVIEEVDGVFTTEWGKGLTREEAHVLLDARIDAAKRGLDLSLTYAKDGKDTTSRGIKEA